MQGIQVSHSDADSKFSQSHTVAFSMINVCMKFQTLYLDLSVHDSFMLDGWSQKYEEMFSVSDAFVNTVVVAVFLTLNYLQQWF